MDIVVEHLSKHFRSTVAVDDLSFTATAGRVTGFVGPNGAGKTTTLRALLGLVEPTSGTATIGGRRLRDLDGPGHTVGALLDTRIGPAGRRVRTHVAITGRLIGAPVERIDAVLDQVGLAVVARRRVGALSTGMRQRLGLAVALLGEPDVLVLDEPLNGLDPAGVRWMRGLLRSTAAAGTTVLLSSHLLSEMELVADDVVMIGGGRLLAAGSIADFGSLEETFLSLTEEVGHEC